MSIMTEAHYESVRDMRTTAGEADGSEGLTRPSHARKRIRRFSLAVVVMGLITAAIPVVLGLASSWISNALGCRLDEGGPHDCTLFGFAIGNILYDMFVMLWFAMVTIPFGGAMAVIGAFVYIAERIIATVYGSRD